MIVKSSIDL